jgi:signal transduction histidine kinase
LAREHAVSFHHRIEGTVRTIKSGASSEIISVLREALINAFTHSNATEMDFYIHYGRFNFTATIRDNGRGIDDNVLSAGGRQGHWGLPGMRERVKHLGGKMRIESARDQGTTITIIIPARLLH